MTLKTKMCVFLGIACSVLACGVAQYALRNGPESTPKTVVAGARVPATPAAGTRPPSHCTVSPVLEEARRLSPEAESNPCRMTALVLEQLLQGATQETTYSVAENQ